MSTPFPHPPELTRLDLFAVWCDAPPVGEKLDPFRFCQRMAVYRHLLSATNRRQIFGADNRKNPLWGLMFQHQWQFRTGRLGGATPAGDHIDPDAPWGYGNYALCIVPWLGAAAAGVVPTSTLLPPEARSQFSYAEGGGEMPLKLPAELEGPVRDWRSFFELVAAARPGDDHEPLRLAMWRAHKTSLDVIAARIAGKDPYPCSWQEQVFLRGWCRMVDYLWAAAWPTDFDAMVVSLDVLPERMLLDRDVGLALADMRKGVRRNVRHIVGLARASGARHQRDLWMWRRVMRARAARDDAVTLLDALFNPTPENRAARLRLLLFLAAPSVLLPSAGPRRHRI
jgi:hypothetical protein